MTQSVLPLSPSLAYRSPETSAGPEGLALQRAWSAAMDAFLDPSSRQAGPHRHHPLTSGAFARLPELLNRERLELAEQLLERFCTAIAGVASEDLPPLRALDADDGSVLLEWTFPDRRLGFTIEPRVKDSGWYFVFSSASSERYEAGTLDQLELDRLIRTILAQRP